MAVPFCVRHGQNHAHSHRKAKAILAIQPILGNDNAILAMEPILGNGAPRPGQKEKGAKIPRSRQNGHQSAGKPAKRERANLSFSDTMRGYAQYPTLPGAVNR